MKKLIVGLACSVASVLVAQDMSSGATAVEQAGGGDDGAQVVAVAETAAKELNASSKPSSDFVPAMKVVKDRITKLRKQLRKQKKLKGVRFGYGTAKWPFEDPCSDKKFNSIRSAKAIEAYLIAKAEIINSIKTSVDVVESTTGKRFENDDPIAKAYAEKCDELEAKKRKLAHKMMKLNEAEAQALRSTSLSEKFGRILDAIAKKLDQDYDAEKYPAEKRALVKQLTAECEAMKEDFAALEKDAKKLSPKVDRINKSEVKALSEMPLLGATIIAQAESWNENTKEYQMSVAVVWSPKLQEEALSISEGTAAAGTPGKYTPEEWIENQNLEVMVGPRTFTDADGNKIFVGIAVADLECPVNQHSLVKRDAHARARGMIATSIGCDMKAYTESKNIVTEYSAGLKQEAGVMQNMSDTIASEAHQPLKGSQMLDEMEFVHPISGRNTYVCAFYVDPEESNSAMDLLTQAYAGAVRQDAANKRVEGIHQGAKDALSEQRASKEDFYRGRAEGRRDVKAKAQKRKPRTIGAGGSIKKSGGFSKGGTYSGDNDIDTDF